MSTSALMAAFAYYIVKYRRFIGEELSLKPIYSSRKAMYHLIFFVKNSKRFSYVLLKKRRF